MATASVTYTFTNGTNADAIQVNQNFTDILTFINTSLVQTDGSTSLANGSVTSAKIADGTIMDVDINASAAIALSKLATGALPTAITIGSGNIVDGTIVNGDISSSAGISSTKTSYNGIGRKRTTSASISNNSWTELSYGVSDFLQGTATSFESATQVIRLSTAGIYLITASVVFAADSNGQRAIRILEPGFTEPVAQGSTSALPSAAGTTTVSCQRIFRISTTKDFLVQVYQNSGGSLNAVSDFSTFFQAIYLGA